VAGETPSSPRLPVSVTIGNVNASVVSASGVKGQPNGLLEVQVRVPDQAPSGVVPLTFQAGASAARQTVSVAVQ
jgi:uncharacterized protein (TIGR03437 family)